MKNNKRKTLRNLIATFSIGAFALISALMVSLFVKDGSKETTNFMAYTDYYDNELSPINTYTVPTKSYVKMSTLYTYDGNNTFTATNASVNTSSYITIETATDLVAFSRLCYLNTNYLKYNYNLIANIDCSSAPEFYPIGMKKTAFTGTFNGNGFDITGLRYLSLKNTNQAEAQAYVDGGLSYYSMFVLNKGYVKNLGLIDPEMSLFFTADTGLTTVAPLVGENQAGGTVDHVYVKYMGSIETAGLTASGGFFFAGLMASNKGTFTNAYASYTTLVAKSRALEGDYNGLQPVLWSNTGTISNVFFYDSALASLSFTDNGDTITYDASTVDVAATNGKAVSLNYGYPYNQTLEVEKLNGNYTNSTDMLCSKVNASDDTNWYVKADYSTLGGYFSNTTPILRGLAYDSENKVFTIEDEFDYEYMYELFNSNSYLAGKGVSYKITKDLNLSILPVDQYKYTGVIGTTITGELASGTGSATLLDGTKPAAPTIYNANYLDRKVDQEGVTGYGLFGLFNGTLENLNVVYSNTINLSVTTSNVLALGSAVGFLEGGTISNVHTYMKLTIDSATKAQVFAGGIVGLVTDGGSVYGSASAGTLTQSNTTAFTDSANYSQGLYVGGAVGYLSDTYGNVERVLSNVALTVAGGSSEYVSVGGVIGGGYLGADSGSLENDAAITIGSSSANAVYSNLYAAGVIGRLLGVQSQIVGFNNYGNITSYLNTTTSSVAGIMNAEIVGATPGSGNPVSGLTNSSYKEKNVYKFELSSVTNGSDITFPGTNKVPTNYTDVINIFSKYGFKTELSGIYNVSYKPTNGTKTKLSDKEIDMFYYQEYAPVLNVIGSTSTYNVEVTTSYNLRNIKYTVSTANTSSKTYKFAGYARGSYITYNDVRNEGNQTVTLNKQLKGTFYISGLFYELSATSTASALYNGGNITFTYNTGNNASFEGKIYAAGICYANRNSISSSDLNKYNPTSASFDNDLPGSIDKAINNGTISVTNPELTGITLTSATVKSANNGQTVGTKYTANRNSKSYVKGNIYTAGITNINESVITNTFNLGDCSAHNYLEANRELNVAGIANLNIGKYAYILNCANDGDLRSMNVSSDAGTDVNVAGIVGRNDKLENGNAYSSNVSNPNSSQMIAFTINYGSLFAYSYSQNIQSTAAIPTCKVAGILAMGLCNVVNTVNYGTIAGGEIASGIFGVVYFSNFAGEVSSSNKVLIANSVNYSTIYLIERGYNGHLVTTAQHYETIVTYSQFVNCTKASLADYLHTSIVREQTYRSITASIIGVVNYDDSSNAQYIVIRYLVNLNENSGSIGIQVKIPSGFNPDTTTMYSAYVSKDTRNNGTGAYVRDVYMSTYQKYAPLITSSFTDRFLTSPMTGDVEDATTETLSYVGAFSTNFQFRKAVEEGEDSGLLDLAHYPSDAFLNNFFQFVNYKYINDNLMDKIGWSTIAYQTAANEFAQNIRSVLLALSQYTEDNISYSDITSSAFASSTWVQHCSQDTMLEVVKTLIKEESYAELLSMLQYVFSDQSSSNVLITQSLRDSIVTAILEANSSIDLSQILKDVLTYDNGYSSVLADSILADNDDVKTYINEYINGLSQAEIEALLYSYVDYLQSNNNAYFNYEDNESKRLALLNALFTNINDSLFYQELINICGVSSATVSDTLKMSSGYATLSTADKKTLFNTIITYNGYSNIATYLDSMASEVSFFSELVKDGYVATSMNTIYDNTAISSTNNTSADVIEARVQLWNQIKDTTTFRTYFTNKYGTNTKIYDLATELNNTFQSNTAPSPGGNMSNDNSYLYTQVITPSTYFYGPYTTNGGTTVTLDIKPNDHSATFNLNTDIKLTYNNYTKDDGGVTADAYNKIYGSTFTTEDPSMIPTYFDHNKGTNYKVNNKLANYTKYNGSQASTFTSKATGKTGGIGNSYLYFYEYGTTSSNNQFARSDQAISGTSQSNRAFSGSRYTLNGKLTDFGGLTFTTTKAKAVDIDGVTFNLAGAATTAIYGYGNGELKISGEHTQSSVYNMDAMVVFDTDGVEHLLVGNANGDSCYYIDESGVTHGIYDDDKGEGQGTGYRGNNTSQTTLSGLWYKYATRYYCAGVNSNWHSTARTGIYRYKSGSYWWTWKHSNGNGICWTTSYIDYNYNQILDLDGYLSSYTANPTYVSNDEKNIINRVWNEYLASDSTNLKKVIQASLLEAIGNNATNGQAYIDTFFNANIYSTTLVNSKIAVEYLKTNSSTTLKQYFMNRANVSSSDNKTKLILAAVNDRVIYSKLIKELIKSNDIAYSASYADYSTLLTYILNNPTALSGNNVDLTKFTSFTNAQLATYFSSFDTTNGVTVTTPYNMNGVTGTGLTSINNPDSYNGNSYTYGMTFSSLTIPNTYSTGVTLIAKSTGSSSTITIGNDPNNTITISGINAYDITLDSTRTIYASDDVVFYAIRETSMPTSTQSGSLSVNSNSYTTMTKANLITAFNNSFDLDLTEDRITNVSLTYTIKNDRYISATLYFYNGTSYVSLGSVGSGASVTYTIDDMTNYYGVTMKVCTSNRGQQNSSDIFTTASYTITYKTVTNIVENDAIVRTRYLNLDLPTYDVIRSSYNKYILNPQTSAYNTFIKAALANLTPVNTSGNDANPTNNLIDGISSPIVVAGFTTAQKEAIVRLIAGASNQSLSNFIAATGNNSNANLKLVYDLLVKYPNGSSFLANAISYGNSSSGVTYTTASNDAITAAYINGDYANIYNLTLTSSSASVYNTKMETLLQKIGSEYNYINSNGTFNNSKFDAFAEYIGYVVTDSGYGIFALSSSEGIKNGAFVPDNIVLRELGGYYTWNSAGYFELSKTLSSDWRTDGTVNSGISSDLYTGDNAVTYSDSVNYGFFIDMKQLKKSIATTVFELDLETTSGDVFTATQSQVDLDNAVINFYIPNGYISTYVGDKTLTIKNIIYPDSASTSMDETTRKDEFSLTTTNQPGLRITAEETSVYKDYIVRFNEIDISFNMEYSADLSSNATNSGTTVTVEPENSIVGFNITSPQSTGDKLPEGMDLLAYVYLEDSNGNKVVDSQGKPTGFTKNDLENNMVIDENGSAEFVVNINDDLPAGTYKLYLDIFGNTEGGQKSYFTLVKKASTECDITLYVYDGSQRTFTLSGEQYTLSTEIPWGRAFNYSDLTYNKGEVPGYLDDFEVSHNANVVSTVASTALTGDKVTYTVTYVITSEDGQNTKTYVHTLVEKTPFATNASFATLYVDGISKGAQSYTSSNVVIYNANTQFTRTESPAYLVRYILGNFYTSETYTSTISGYYSPSNISTINKTTVAGLATSPAEATPLGTGFSISVSTSEETGYYIYTYVYSRTGTWFDGEEEYTYTREMMLPALKLYKSYSLVSLLQTVQILQADPLLGALATVVNPEYSVVPVEQTKITNSSVSYYYLTGAIGNNKVSVDASTSRVNYSNIGTDYSDRTDFYIVGTTSGAELSSYSPTLGIDEYAEIYQYTTTTKLTTYGTENQGNDYDVLNNHNNIYLYVPYNYVENNVTKTEIFLVELTSSGWGRVYSTEWKGTNVDENVATVGSNKSFKIGNVSYTLSSYAGTTNEGNTSLKWDYTGTPAENTFWYNSYVIFSEKDVKNKYSTENAKFYHFAIIDQSNNINFKFKVVLADGVLSQGQTDLGDLYLSMVYTYDKKVQQGSQMTSVETTESIGVNLTYDSTEEEYVIPASTPLQLLPAGYYSFYIDFGQENSNKRLAVTIQLSSDCTKRNQNTDVDDPESEYYGQYLPPSSIVTQTVMMIITISPDTSSGSSSTAAWAAGYTEKVHSSAALLPGNSKTPYESE